MANALKGPKEKLGQFSYRPFSSPQSHRASFAHVIHVIRSPTRSKLDHLERDSLQPTSPPPLFKHRLDCETVVFFLRWSVETRGLRVKVLKRASNRRVRLGIVRSAPDVLALFLLSHARLESLKEQMNVRSLSMAR